MSKIITCVKLWKTFTESILPLNCAIFYVITIFLHIYIERTSPVYFIKDLRNCLKGNNL